MNERSQTNSKSVISLTLGIISIVIPIIGLVIGIIGVVVSRKAAKEIAFSNESGSGFATAGLVCSVVGIVLQTFIVVAYFLFASVMTVK
ncbi:MAG: DUF4190 domain-containing protein [Paenisporosarcina sp.]|nr:DUF4190 domain-containing protein [Paenisporosarcina sp.]